MTNITSHKYSATPTYPRALESAIDRDLSLYPAVALVGARQVGKSTLARFIADRRGMDYRTLDLAETRQQAREDPGGFLRGLGHDGALIDEVQRVPELSLEIKAAIDRDRTAGKWLLTGSAQRQLRRGIGDSLVGRVSQRILRPLVTSELRYDAGVQGWSALFDGESELLGTLELNATHFDKLDWRQIVPAGGYPDVVLAHPDAQREIANNYLTTFLARDLPEVLTVSSPESFERFVRLLATRIGHPQNNNGIAADLGVSAKTAGRWIDALQRCFLVELIPPFFSSASQRVIKSSKLYFNDAGMALVAANESEPNGFHLENYLATDLRVWEGLHPGRHIYYRRIQGGTEIDFVLEQDRHLVAVEVKGIDVVGPSDTRHLQRFVGEHGALRGVLLSADPTIRMLARNVVAAPWWTAV